MDMKNYKHEYEFKFEVTKHKYKITDVVEVVGGFGKHGGGRKWSKPARLHQTSDPVKHPSALLKRSWSVTSSCWPSQQHNSRGPDADSRTESAELSIGGGRSKPLLKRASRDTYHSEPGTRTRRHTYSTVRL